MLKPDGKDLLRRLMMFYYEFAHHKLCRLWLGNEPVLLLYNAETVEVLLNSSKHMTKSYLYKFLEPWLRTGLLTSTGDKWRVRRKLLTPSFHFRILTDFLQVFNEQTSQMIDRLKKEKADQREFDMFPYITLCALDVICDTAMGTTVNAQANQDSEYVKAIYDIGEIIQRRQKNPLLWSDFLFNRLEVGKTHNKYLKILHGFSEKVIRERSAEFEERLKTEGAKGASGDETPPVSGRKNRLAFLDMLLQANAEGAALDFLDIREEVDTFMLEGHDTTAAATGWAVHLLGAHPEVQQKAQNELHDIFGDSDRPVTMDDIKNMKYLECVVKEALRLFPSVPFYGRTLSEDCTIGGYEVPKGTQAIIVTNALHRDPDYFPDAERFDPDRWLQENPGKRHPYCYIPFSAGLRNCIGQKFAMNEEKVFLSSILRNFTIESCQKREELNPVGELIQRPEQGIKVKLSLRKQQ